MLPQGKNVDNIDELSILGLQVIMVIVENFFLTESSPWQRI